MYFPQSVRRLTQDDRGNWFSPESCSHVFTYNGFLVLTDTATDGNTTWRKTYSYTGLTLTNESKWVVQ
jgi:hypothetical protein